MARGWESKSVESQIEDAADRVPGGEPLDAAQREVQRKLQSLDLSRRRVRQEIAATRSEARRKSLETALAFLDEEIRKLTSSEASSPP
jgi:molecular chaperone GrpE (heat shock protein)